MTKFSKNERRTYLASLPAAMLISNGHKTNMNPILFWHYQCFMDLTVSCQKEIFPTIEIESIIYWSPTNELDCIKAVYESHEIMMKIKNHVRESEPRSVHMSTCQSSNMFPMLV